MSPWLSQSAVFCFGVSSLVCSLQGPPPGHPGSVQVLHTPRCFSHLTPPCACSKSAPVQPQPTLDREPRTRAPADHSSQQENSQGALEQPRDQQALANLSPACVHHATEFWLFVLVRRFYSAPVDHHATHSTEQGFLHQTGTEERLL